MSVKFSRAFKAESVRKALNRDPTVIPAKAGIHLIQNHPLKHTPTLNRGKNKTHSHSKTNHRPTWIPAFAGMTVGCGNDGWAPCARLVVASNF